jgi:hypothetical protein
MPRGRAASFLPAQPSRESQQRRFVIFVLLAFFVGVLTERLRRSIGLRQQRKPERIS